MSSIEVRIPRNQRKRPVSFAADDFLRKKKIVSPGDVITEASDYMRGHGTFVENEKIVASVTGTVEIVNKLISVKPLKTRYNGEVGDVVVGRIKEVGQKRWKVDTFAKLDSVLMLSAVNLPGGELRRRSVQDELMMRDVLSEGDLISVSLNLKKTFNRPFSYKGNGLIASSRLSSTASLNGLFHQCEWKYKFLHTSCRPDELIYARLRISVLENAEVQSIFQDGSLSLHTRSQKYGKLEEGLLVQVSPSLIKRCKTHFHNLPCGVSVIIGNNGYIWIQPYEEKKSQGVTRDDREMIARLRNCILALTDHRMLIHYSSLDYAVEASKQYNIKDLLKPEVKDELAQITKQRLEEL